MGKGRVNRRASGPKSVNPHRINSILSSSLPSVSIESKIREYRVIKLWKEAVGELLSKRVSPSRLIGRTLYCTVSNSAWMAELNYQKGLVASRINEALGEDAVDEIVLQHGKVVQPKVKTPAKAIKQRELSADERRFIDEAVSGLKDGSLKGLIKRVMEKAKGSE